MIDDFWNWSGSYFSCPIYMELLMRTDNQPRRLVKANQRLVLKRLQHQPTYKTIKGNIKEKHNVKVSTLYIAQIKKKYEFDLRENYNISKKRIKEFQLVLRKKKN